jgi:hypothetical protein
MAIADGSVLTAADLAGITNGAAGAWASYTPTWTNLTVGNGTVVAAYKQIGKTAFFRIAITFGTTTTVSGVFYPSTPVTFLNVSPVAAMLFDSSATIWNTGVLVPGSYILAPTAGRCAAAVPWTWATGDIIWINGSYEAA